jgi:hypothetical protein
MGHAAAIRLVDIAFVLALKHNAEQRILLTVNSRRTVAGSALVKHNFGKAFTMAEVRLESF